MTIEQHEMYVIAIILNSNNIAAHEAEAVINAYVINATTQHAKYNIVVLFHNMTRAVWHINRSLHSKIYRCHDMDYFSMETYLS